MTDPAALPDFSAPGFRLSDLGTVGAPSNLGLPPVGSGQVHGAAPATIGGAGPVGGPGDGVAARPPVAGLPPLRERVVRALVDAGYPAGIDEDGDVAVTVAEQRLFVRCVDSSPPLMRVFGLWLMDDLPDDELARLRAANLVTASVNLAKATVHGDRLEVAVDLLAGDGFHLPSLLDASLDAVLGCVRSWHDAVLELSGAGRYP